MIFKFPLSLLAIVMAILAPYFAFSFSFTEDAQKETAAEAAVTKNSLAKLHCPKSIKAAKIVTMIGEIHRDDRTGLDGFYGSFMTPNSPDWNSRFGTTKSVYGNLVDDLNGGFQQLGLKTNTAAEINAQIARVEQEAVLNNDLDAAVAAADRLSANFMLKGIISTRSQMNKVVNVDEVFVTINLSLLDRNGTLISTAQINETTFSDADILSTIQKLVKNQSREITYQLFKDYCKGGN
ncbi:MAG: hypothetical protein KJ630_05430 [Proteobacteria bacterium]|nr:hypothetical protein [Pseudomonadota bacterium]